uniref:Uncharacterized protein n=1 Tax=Rhizophora mucronata TaxID=61149 RepID=A0A2P2NPP6_RHIMU
MLMEFSRCLYVPVFTGALRVERRMGKWPQKVSYSVFCKISWSNWRNVSNEMV